MPKRILFILLTGLMLTAANVIAQTDEPGATTREVVEQRLEDMKTRLDLDDYTWSQVERILKSSIRERVAIARRYGLDGELETLAELEGSEKRAAKRELKQCRKDVEKRMKRYLDKDQYKEFKAIQEEIHEEMLARIERI
jgi:hypothetical protein